VSIFLASIAIATLVVTLAAAIIRTIRQINENNTRIDIENTHTIAVVCILFISIPQVWFSARLGTFTTESGAIHVINTMNSSLNGLKEEDRLSTFPVLRYGGYSSGENGSLMSTQQKQRKKNKS